MTTSLTTADVTRPGKNTMATYGSISTDISRPRPVLPQCRAHQKRTETNGELRLLVHRYQRAKARPATLQSPEGA
jgi:hypothetical protein